MRLTATDEHPLRTIRHIAEQSITVGDLTQRDLWRAVPQSPAQRVLGEMDERSLDTAPLDEDPIRRYVTREDIAHAPGDTRVGDLARVIGTPHLVTGDLGLADGLALLRDRQFLFVIEGDTIAGIITYADLQRIPVTMVTLSLILAAEVGLNALIEGHYHAEEEWLAQVSKERRDDLEDRYSQLVMRNEDTSRIDCLMIADRLKLVGKIPDLREGLGYPSGVSFKSWTRRLEDVRNDLAHGRTLLDAGPDAACALDLLSEIHNFAERIWEAVIGRNNGPCGQGSTDHGLPAKTPTPPR